ncbi:hypothetical protein [Aureimonas psammosilenae]|uniref:hypothetical protein n=1 Tax=Aureimonas psammosilenae TaxID=2495496 RepID=UPI001260E8DF|nr:hypothetical protein [Aureimonas psammosilenae]
MSMRSEVHAGAAALSRPEQVETVEMELALDMHEPSAENFEACVRGAAEVVGGEILFDVPSDGSVEDASRIAAIRVPGATESRIVFAVLDEDEREIRVADREEVGERFHGFAEAYVGVLKRIRDDLVEDDETPATLAS